MTGAAPLLIAAIAYVAVCGAIGYACGSGRGRGAAGFWLGVIIGPLGWLFALFLPSAYRRAPRRRGRWS